MDVVTDVVIDRTPADVAAFASNPDNVPAWYTNIQSVRWETDPPLRIGSRVAFVAPQAPSRTTQRRVSLRCRRDIAGPIDYSQRSFRSLTAVTRNCGIGLSVFTVSFVFESGASSRSTFVSVLVFDSPAGIIIPVTSTL